MAEVARFVDLDGVAVIGKDVLDDIRMDSMSLGMFIKQKWDHANEIGLPSMKEITNYMTQFWHDLSDEERSKWLGYIDKGKEVKSADDLYNIFVSTVNDKIEEVKGEGNVPTHLEVGVKTSRYGNIKFKENQDYVKLFEMILRQANNEGIPLVIKDQHGGFYLNRVYQNIVDAFADQVGETMVRTIPKSGAKYEMKTKVFNKNFYTEFIPKFDAAVTETKKDIANEKLRTEIQKGKALSKELVATKEELKTIQQRFNDLNEQKEKMQHEVLIKIQRDELSYDQLQDIRRIQIKLQNDEKEYEERLKRAFDENPTFSKNADSLARLIDSIRETLITLFPYAIGGSIVGGGIAGGFILNSKEQEKYNITNDEFQKNLTKLNFKDPRMIEIREDFIKANEKELNKITNSSLKTNGRHRVLLQKAMSLGYLPKNVDFNQSVD